MSNGARSHKHGALMFIDLDNFKTLNDTQRPDVSDLLLKVARRMQQVSGLSVRQNRRRRTSSRLPAGVQ